MSNNGSLLLLSLWHTPIEDNADILTPEMTTKDVGNKDPGTISSLKLVAKFLLTENPPIHTKYDQLE